MKITFVHFGRENLGIEYLSAVVKRAGHEVFLAHDPGLFSREDNVFHTPALEKFFSRKKAVLAKIEKSNPDIVAFSVYTSTYPWALDVAGEVKKKIGAKVVFGGIHATLVPETVIQNDVVDYVIEGEGEEALLDLVEALSSKTASRNIPNVWVRKNGIATHTPVRPPITDLDSLPLPDKALFEDEINHGDDYMIMTSRGCQFSCHYCCESYLRALYGRGYFRRRSVSSVIQELTEMKKKYNFKRVMFFDSVFFADKKWLEELLKEYQRKISVPFRCQGHVAFADAGIIGMMKEAGCYGIDFGVQTFNEEIRKKILNRSETNDEIKKAFKNCDQAGLRYDVDLIFSLPLMKEKDYLFALEFVESCRYLNRIKCFNLCYYPKLKITQKAKELGVISESDMAAFERGEGGDFFHTDGIGDPAEKRMKDSLQKLYKVYPLLPGFFRRWIIGKKHHLCFHWLPKPMVVLAQFIIGVVKNDLRIYTYLSYYLGHLMKKVGCSRNPYP
jgi:tRNA A37 methylthiotransferase MiaB